MHGLPAVLYDDDCRGRLATDAEAISASTFATSEAPVNLTPVFRGRVLPGGLLVLNRPKDYARYVRGFAGSFVEVVLRKQRTKRSLKQNAWHWSTAVPLIADALGYDAHEHEDVHYALVAKCFGTHRDEKLKLDLPNVRSSHLTTEQFSLLMEWEVRWAAQEYGIVVPLPGDSEAAA